MAGEHSEEKKYTDNMGITTLPFDKLTANFSAWLLNPLPEVGNRNAPLHTAPTSIDSSSQPGCKSQTYTTWNCWNRSYYAGHALQKQGVTSTPPVTGCEGRPLFASKYSDIPEAFLLQQPTAVNKMLQVGKRWYSEAFDPKGQTYTAIELERRSIALAKERLKTCCLTGPRRASPSDSRVHSPESDFDTLLEHHPTPTTSSTHERRDGHVGDPKPQAAGTSYLYGDILPTRAVDISSWVNSRNYPADIPKSSMYKLMQERLQDHTNVGALGSLTRGPSVRDATSIMALVKAMENRPSSIYEHAALVRSGLIVASLDKFSYGRDPLPTQMLRRFVPSANLASKIYIVTRDQSWSVAVSVLAITLDMFISWALNKASSDMPQDWSYGDLDTTITAVPINSTALSSPWAMAYLLSFLSSELWNGKVNHVVSGAWEDNNWDQTYKGKVTLMPSSNSVFVPGGLRLLIVLVDVSSSESPPSIRPSPLTVDVPVVRGIRQRQVPVDITNWWHDSYFVTGNVTAIRADFTWAWNHICERLGVGGACGYAASLVSELYGCQRFGVGVKRTYFGGIDNTNPALGAWAWKGGFADTRRDGMIRCDTWPENTDLTDNTMARSLITGFNFASVSPLHTLPTGLVRCKYTVLWTDSVDGNTRIPDVTLACWSTSTPQYTVPGYRCNSMTAVFRIGTYCGLLDTHEANLRAYSANGLTSYFHMLAGALGLSVSLFLSGNDISFKNWVGLDLRCGQMRPVEVVSAMKDTLSAGMLVHNDISAMELSSGGDWDWDHVGTYYGVTHILTDNDFASHSPWPIHAVNQWADKLGLIDGRLDRRMRSRPVEASTTGDYDTLLQGIILQHDAGTYKMLVPGTTDLRRYRPVIVYRQHMYSMACMSSWVENWQYLSQIYVGATNDRQYWESLCLTLPIQDYMFESDKVNDLQVLNTKYFCAEERDYALHTSSIKYPDPPDSNSFLSAAKAYIVDPTISGLLQLLTTGNPISAVGKAGQVAYENYKQRNPPAEPHQKSSGILPPHPTTTETLLDQSGPEALALNE